MKKKTSFSKLLLLQESVLIWILTLSFIALAFLCIQKGFLGTLPWLTSLSALPWSAYAVSQAFYYNKSKAENCKEGVVYEATMAALNKQEQEEDNIDYGI